MKPTLAMTSMLLLAACATRMPEGPQAPPKWTHAPSHQAGLSSSWWEDFGDPQLGGLIQRAWKHNPDIEMALQRVQLTRADRFEALAAFFPSAGLQVGFREGREKTRESGFRPSDLKPWTAGGGISWELDLTGKRRAMLRASEAGEAEAWAAWKGSRLLIATEVCAARFEQSLYAAEAIRQRRQLAAEREATQLSRQLLERGLIDSGDHADRVATMEYRQRHLSELERLSENARLRLQRLVGGNLPEPHAGTIRLAPAPTRVPARVWQSRPDLIGAEAAVRRAFAISDGARLDLLPTLSLQAGGSVASSSPRDGYEIWTGSVGPKLDIPVWDPQRIAKLHRSKAAAQQAVARFQSTSDKAVEEIETAYNNFKQYQAQLASHGRETSSRSKAFKDAEEKFQAGLISAIERTASGRAYSESAESATRMRLKALNARLHLIRALGG